ncbi:MAG: phosphoribosylformylglycinamidine synthase, partial [Alphaproteobacteria bacterium]|nr:phosphoribosylformylglycinamidine synthase [Alphaproteobacteria bacterium]
HDGKSLSIPGTLLISAIGIVDDVQKCVSMDFKQSGNLIYCLGKTYDELGGSIYLATYDLLGSSVPKVKPKQALRTFKALNKAVKNCLVESIHDCSDGGFVTAIAEMAFSGGLGAEVDLKRIPYKGQLQRDDIILFSESNSRFIVEIKPENQKKFEKLLKDMDAGLIGSVQEDGRLSIQGLNGELCINADVMELKEAWQKPLKW